MAQAYRDTLRNFAVFCFFVELLLPRFFSYLYAIVTYSRSWDSSVGIALGYGLDDRGFKSRQELGMFPFTTTSRPALGPTQSPVKWIPGSLSLGIKRPEHEADHSPPSSTEVKNVWSYTSTPQYAFMEWCSVKAQEHLYLYL
jgi:hypothetical protein